VHDTGEVKTKGLQTIDEDASTEAVVSTMHDVIETVLLNRAVIFAKTSGWLTVSVSEIWRDAALEVITTL